ncbi:CRISPR-associated protein Cmr4 [Moraxella bovoculi]|uniref:CRISPR-associated RAMP protein, Cmr4 family n=1 Tax=Moraxella bovoculi 237 TaxID=743974 RepID=A0A066UBX5_9GAMM|nr:type III-B CRISPR module RAMP protein Cmr4 [Moraxella bovoculi]AKG16670.1 type III-B CRISPR module RAMP protein Cmr4 [Moraxella bovoculi]AKG18401.1 CRISPR-associated protein Cmr4 [Moraxella bovoculi]ALT07406.1 type III-B CRISPR module RAMP protein Cmr4 [Moraxella bovoculi]KDN24610.1 CRISPR-associated RAMP protein, Cmr4 family [Moraxella bovoculi 237]NSM10897.1 type III-B CRISPR module RAMP protein Cmr4 [Moraxella bovoculi]
MQTRIFYLQNLSALHVGTGQGVGVVDLPIMRAKATNLPIVAGSAIKGVLRDELKAQCKISDKDINTLFGKNENADHAGAIAFGDAHLLLLPIRSFAGTVAYATCPFVLRQYQRDVGVDLDIPNINDNQALITSSTLLIGNQIALEDLDIEAVQNEKAGKIADMIVNALYPDLVLNADGWRNAVKSRFVVLPDDIFSFLADTATEIRTRIRINRETRVVQDGALWTEENLPADSVLWGVLGVSQSRDKDNKKDATELAELLPTDELNIQVGGKHTVGRGLCRLLINEIAKKGA